MITYRIYQVNKDHFRDVAFRDYENVKRDFGEPKRDWYDLVYEFESEDELTPDDLYRTFNLYQPDDFKGHSLSVSDVVEMVGTVESGDGYWYCDSFGWMELEWRGE